MSFQAYLYNIQEKTGKTPNDFVAEARAKGLTKPAEIVAWLKADYRLGIGHARALDYVTRNRAEFTVRQTSGTHRDVTGTLILDGSSLKDRASKG